MISIIEFFGENYRDFRLKDDNTSTGGVSHPDETLDEFMAECDITFNDDIITLARALVECGVEFQI